MDSRTHDRPGSAWKRRLALIAVLALVLAACGSEGGDTTTTAGSSEPGGDTTTTSEATPTIDEEVPNPVQIGVGGMGSLAYTAAYVAVGAGYLDEELEPLGTTGELVGFDGSVAGIQAVVSGDVPYVASVTSGMLNAIAQGAEIQQISQFLNTDLVFLTAAQGQPTDISNPAAMVEGKRWGIPQFGSSGHVTSLKTLNAWGFTADDVTFVETGNVTSAIGAVEQGIADYYWLGTAGFVNLVAEAGGDGTLNLVLNFYDPEVVADIFGGPYATSGLMASPDFLESHPETSAAVVRAFARALAFISENVDNPEAIAEMFPEDLRNDSTVRTLEWVAGGHSSDGIVLEDAIQRVIDSLKAGGLIEESQEFDLASIVNNDFAG